MARADDVFLDEVEIKVVSGRGGDGVVHFRREKYVPRGGPDGGDGGVGGDVVFQADGLLSSLSHLRRPGTFAAEDGKRGGSQKKTGRRGNDLVLRVPAGTLVRDGRSGDVLADLVEPGQRFVVCRGGRGGRGNARFATARNQAPRMAEKGEPGKELRLRLELRLIADVGIVGVPNAGKSTLLAALTTARPKIAAYPFTTLVPNLGVVEFDDGDRLILADIPGLIEGAHRGVGLGTTFLRHIQRTRALIHLLDGASPDPVADFSQVNAELAVYDPRLRGKPQVVAVNKSDLPEVRDRWPALSSALRGLGHRPLLISALERTGLDELLRAARRASGQARRMPNAALEELPVYRPEADPRAVEIQRESDGAWRVVGAAVERAAEMTYWDYDEAVQRFQQLLERLGVDQALREAGVREGDTVRIASFELEWRG